MPTFSIVPAQLKRTISHSSRRVESDSGVSWWLNRDECAMVEAVGRAANAAYARETGSKMTATLRVTHKSIGVEVRRGPYDIIVDAQRVGSLAMNDTIEIPLEVGRHTVKLRSGRNSSRTHPFEVAEGQTVAFRCTGKSFLPVFLASFVVPGLALHLHREVDPS